jgi:phage shock protein PspC (stress-responsive transcriptional regulator)
MNEDSRSKVLIWVGAGIVVAGGIALLTSTGLIPVWIFSWWDRLRFPLSLIAIGIAVIVLARSGIHRPVRGTKLYRSRDDRWLAGVLAGLAHYFGVDPTAMRLVFLALLLAGVGWLVLAYLIMAFVVPVEPDGAGTPPAAPIPPADSTPPVAPTPPADSTPPAGATPPEGGTPS